MSGTNLFAIQDEFVKNIIKDTIETYSGQWRIIHEAIQNAHDAIQLNEKIKKGKIEIDLHAGTNKVVITDNGIGISPNKFKNVFLLGGSDKATEASARKILKGSQGVGIKATLFTSKKFKIETVHEEEEWSLELTNCYKFLEQGFKQEIPSPQPKKTKRANGTTIEYSLDDFSVLEFLQEIIEEYVEELFVLDQDIANKEFSEVEISNLIEVYFRTKTYIGCVQTLLEINKNLKPIEVEVRVHLDFPSINDHRKAVIKHASVLSDEKNHGKTAITSFPGKYLDFLKIHENLSKDHRADKVYQNFEDVIQNPPSETLKKLLIQKFNKDQAKRLLYKTKTHSDGRREFIPDNALEQKHNKVLSKLNGIYLTIGPRPYLANYFNIQTRQLLSVNGLPTNIVLNPPRGALSYLNNVHILIDVDVKLGFGKRNIAGRTMGQINNFFIDVWSTLRRVAPAIVGMREGKDPSNLNKWDEDIEFENFQAAENILRTKPFFVRIAPQDEQEVVALFFELLGRKIITGYFPFRLGSKTVYDGLFYIDEEAREKIPENIKARMLKTVEFKSKLSFLIADFNEEEKYLKEIDLAICWENDCQDLDSDYTVSSLERDNIKPLPSATHRVRKGTESCQVIVLKDVINKLELRS